MKTKVMSYSILINPESGLPCTLPSDYDQEPIGVDVIEKAPTLAALKQSREALLACAPAIDTRSPAYQELKKALDMIKEIL